MAGLAVAVRDGLVDDRVARPRHVAWQAPHRRAPVARGSAGVSLSTRWHMSHSPSAKGWCATGRNSFEPAEACASWQLVQRVPSTGMPWWDSISSAEAGSWHSRQRASVGAASWLGLGELWAAWQSVHSPSTKGACVVCSSCLAACSAWQDRHSSLPVAGEQLLVLGAVHLVADAALALPDRACARCPPGTSRSPRRGRRSTARARAGSAGARSARRGASGSSRTRPRRRACAPPAARSGALTSSWQRRQPWLVVLPRPEWRRRRASGRGGVGGSDGRPAGPRPTSGEPEQRSSGSSHGIPCSSARANGAWRWGRNRPVPSAAWGVWQASSRCRSSSRPRCLSAKPSAWASWQRPAQPRRGLRRQPGVGAGVRHVALQAAPLGRRPVGPEAGAGQVLDQVGVAAAAQVALGQRDQLGPRRVVRLVAGQAGAALGRSVGHGGLVDRLLRHAVAVDAQRAAVGHQQVGDARGVRVVALPALALATGAWTSRRRRPGPSRCGSSTHSSLLGHAQHAGVVRGVRVVARDALAASPPGACASSLRRRCSMSAWQTRHEAAAGGAQHRRGHRSVGRVARGAGIERGVHRVLVLQRAHVLVAGQAQLGLLGHEQQSRCRAPCGSWQAEQSPTAAGSCGEPRGGPNEATSATVSWQAAHTLEPPGAGQQPLVVGGVRHVARAAQALGGRQVRLPRARRTRPPRGGTPRTGSPRASAAPALRRPIRRPRGRRGTWSSRGRRPASAPGP